MRQGLPYALTLGLLAIGGLGLSACDTAEEYPVEDGGEIVLSEPADGDYMGLVVSQKVTLDFDSNPTTGYFWSYVVSGDAAAVEEVSSDYVADPAPEGVVGSGGRQVFEFVGAAGGEALLTFSYARGPEDVFETREIKLIVLGETP